MKTSIKILIGIIILALIVLGFSIFNNPTGNVVKEDKPVIKIGAPLPLTGESSILGEGCRNSILLAKDELKDTKYNYDVVFEDIKNFDSGETTSAIQKLINVDNVDAVITETSGPGNIVSPLTQQNKILHIGIASDANIAKGEYNFIDWTSPKEENRAFIQELKNRGIKKIAIIALNQQGIVAIIDDMKSKLQGTGIEITYDELFNPGQKDFRTILLKARESNPDIYFMQSLSPELELSVKQAQELGINNITTIEAFEFSSQPELFNGYWYVSAAEPNQEFNNKYQQKYNKMPPLASPNCYDAFNLIVKSYEDAGKNLGANEKPTTKQAADDLTNIKGFKGALGELNVLDDGIVDSKAILREMRNGKPVTIGGSN